MRNATKTTTYFSSRDEYERKNPYILLNADETELGRFSTRKSAQRALDRDFGGSSWHGPRIVTAKQLKKEMQEGMENEA